MSDEIKYTAKLVLTPARGFRLVERDAIVISEDGTYRILKAGTRLPLYDEKLVVEVEPPASSS